MKRTLGFFALLVVVLTANSGDVLAKSKDRIVLGRVAIGTEQGDQINLDQASIFKSGDVFVLWVLSESSSRATGMSVEENGEFRWKLEPGDYIIADYMWSTKAGGLNGNATYLGDRVWARFTVDEHSDATHVGLISLELQANRRPVLSVGEDPNGPPQISGKANESATVTTSLLALDEPESADTLNSICATEFGIQCGDELNGVTVKSPKHDKVRVFKKIRTIAPEFEWLPSTVAEATYDFVLYEAYYQKTMVYGPPGSPGGFYSQGRVHEYVEGLQEPSYTLTNQLEHDKRYYWSVRVRLPEKVSKWSTRKAQSSDGFRKVIINAELFGFKSPAEKKRRSVTN